MSEVIFKDTIFALSSGRLPAGVSVIRVSGPGTRNALQKMAGGVPPVRRAAYRAIKIRPDDVVDRGIVIFFAGPESFTGEDSAEFQVHGSRAVVSALLGALAAIDGFRQAEAGEFVRRAFLNGRLDLVEVEALADLIGAETEAQRRFAMTNTQGAQTVLYDAWRSRIIHARAMIEAEIDFSDEADVPGSVSETIWADMNALILDIKNHIKNYHSAEIVLDGYQVVIIGAPNAGKSSLLNALARREAAIVTDLPGTTRDLVEVSLDLDGMKVVLVDTAGIRKAGDRIEAIGMERAFARAKKADLILELRALDNEVKISIDALARRLVVATKVDLLDPAGLTAANAKEQDGPDHMISTITGQGIDVLLGEIGRLAHEAAESGGDILPSRLRHVALLERCVKSLEVATTRTEMALELRAEELRDAGFSLGRISGAVGVEDLLDAIFSEFCIGK